MGIFDALTGAPAKKAAAENRNLLNANLGAGMGYLDVGKGEGLGYLESGKTEGLGYLDQAIGSYAPLAALGSKYGGGTNMLLDAQGVNGPAGNARATGAFQAGPGYQFQMGQGLEALGRKRSGGNMYNSGNTDIDAMTYGQGLANQEYGNWMNRFNQFVNPELVATQGAAGGQAAGYTGQAELGKTMNTNMAQLTASDAANRVNLGNTTTSGLTSNNNMEAQAKMAASGNALGLGMNLLSLGTSALGGGGLFGKM